MIDKTFFLLLHKKRWLYFAVDSVLHSMFIVFMTWLTIVDVVHTNQLSVLIRFQNHAQPPN